MELRPGQGRQPDATYYAERLEEAELVEQLGLGAVWGSEHHADGDGHLPQQLPFLAAVAARATPAWSSTPSASTGRPAGAAWSRASPTCGGPSPTAWPPTARAAPT